MNILVIGNGFDLAHGLPTRYDDFLNFVEEFIEYKVTNECNMRFLDYFKSLNETNINLYDQIDGLIEDNRWLNYFLTLRENKVLLNKLTWIDFESEISKVIKTFDEYRNKLISEKVFENEQMRIDEHSFDVLHYILEKKEKIIQIDCLLSLENIRELKEELITDLNRLIRCLEIYLDDYVRKNYFDKLQKIKFIEALKIDKILTFNYTNTYEHVYGKSNINFDYIHGKADIKHNLNSCNLVLGIDEYLGENEKNSNIEFIQFKKFFQRIYKGTGCLYKDWIKFYTEQKGKTPKIPHELNLYFIGHSLDVTDKDILKELILFDEANTTIYYHNQEALGRMIANLVKVIGEDELIRRTGGSNACIKFVQQPNCGDKYD
ncbi:bacteriophage abortive infection AbiH family protein [Holdemanella porci]|uniref:bacteriophage abortive infection AbiH family protein n=1 Tax=Holdemanella porci TaxID=2652276 RepID=UPI001D15D070|nr:bacteriophage abortive infection AbiH family protein [Holdemanella porci]MCC3360369.1 bacteriophage abortive infection AbiH family protein [Holdemanella porci]